MERIREAIILPLIVFPAAAITAIGIGWLLHRFPAPAHHGDISMAAIAALGLVILVTAAGFIADARAGTPPDSHPHH